MNEQQRLLVRASVDTLRRNTQALSDLFYDELFALEPELEAVFRPDPAVRLTKFANMLSTFANIKYLDKLAPALKALGKRHIGYGVARRHYGAARQAVLLALTKHLGPVLTEELRAAWEAALDEVIGLMDEAYKEDGGDITADSPPDAIESGASVIDGGLLEAIGGRDVIERVHRRFYNVIFEDDWLGRFFWGKSLEALVKKQTDFMTACFGGENHYQGETPAIAHMHMFITGEMAELREHLLRQAILAEGVSEALADRWLAVETAFRGAVIKDKVEDCVMRCIGQRPITAPKPVGYPWPLQDSALKN